jgi:hypothetical protein
MQLLTHSPDRFRRSTPAQLTWAMHLSSLPEPQHPLDNVPLPCKRLIDSITLTFAAADFGSKYISSALQRL